MGVEIIWQPQAGPQTALITCPVFEVFFGGARGGGKTDGVLGDWASHADLYGKDAIGLMVRRTRTELVETIERSRVLYTPLGWKFNDTDKMWRSPEGARLRFAYLERDADADAYQGHSYTRVYVEEAGTFPSYKPIAKLMATLRSGAGVPVGMRLTGNPGGPGHHWVRARYIDPAPAGMSVMTDDVTGLERVYIPSRVGDNAFLDAGYVQRLKAVGSENLVRAWLEGDWSVIDGAFFDCWSYDRHVVRPFAVPDEWLRFRSADWGSAAPFSVGWWAVVPDDYRTQDGRTLPRGCLVRYREWYGASGPNVGLKLTAEAVARGIKAREVDEEIAYGVLDPAAFAVDGGPSIAQMMAREGVIFRPADNRRVAQKGALSGWDQMRARMVGDPEGRPMMVVFDTCADFIRTVPTLQHDPARPEDLDTKGEDHCFSADTLVRTDKGLYSIVDLVGTNGRVQSHDGRFYPFQSARLVKRNQPIVRLAFSDGSTVECTQDHKFLTAAGWMEAKDLAGRKILSLSVQPLKSSTVRDITFAGATISARGKGFTERFGKTITGLCLKATTSITAMVIRATMPLPIWSAFQALFISGTGMARRPVFGAVSALNGQHAALGNGMAARKDASGTANNTRNTAQQDCGLSVVLNASNASRRSRLKAGPSSVPINASPHGAGHLELMTSGVCVPSAGLGSRPIDIPKSGHARAIAGLSPALVRELECLKVSEAGEADVYCLTVPGTGNFALANGALVSNCADEARYGVMSRPYIPRVREPERPTALIYEAREGGRVVANMSVFDIVKAKERKRKIG